MASRAYARAPAKQTTHKRKTAERKTAPKKARKTKTHLSAERKTAPKKARKTKTHLSACRAPPDSRCPKCNAPQNNKDIMRGFTSSRTDTLTSCSVCKHRYYAVREFVSSDNKVKPFQFEWLCVPQTSEELRRALIGCSAQPLCDCDWKEFVLSTLADPGPPPAWYLNLIGYVNSGQMESIEYEYTQAVWEVLENEQPTLTATMKRVIMANESKSDVGTGYKSEVRAAPKIQIDLTSNDESPDALPTPEAEAEPEPEPEADTEAEAEPEPEADAEAEPEPEPEP
jgi:hypothetical protein